MSKLFEALRWYRLGVSWRKSWELASFAARKRNAMADLAVIFAILLAYVVVAWNDEATAAEAASYKAACDRAARVAAEAHLAHCLNGGWFNSSTGVINCGRAL